MDVLGDLKEICDIKPFDEIYISTDDDESLPQISDVCSLKNDALPEASKGKYYRIYHDFKKWQKVKNVTTISEPLLMEYFQELSAKQKPTSLWAYYSMLKRTLQVNLNTDISSYNQVLAFLKSNSSGYEPVKSKNFTLDEVVKFVVEAPDDVWLDVKTVCIFGVCGSLKNGELRSIKYGDVERHGNILLVRIEDSITKACRSFTITGEFYNIVKKYVALRPLHAPIDRFFLNYQREKCTIQPIGKNKFARMPQKIAQYLSLPEPDRYTGQAFRLSGQVIMKSNSQTIEGRMIETIARNYSARSNITHSVSRSDDASHDTIDSGTADPDETACKDIEPAEADGSSVGVENLLKVDNLRLHCTVCDIHLGCAVADEGNIRTHPILFVTQCKDCHSYYNRRDFTRGADGSDMQCRWCAQGGEVYSCSHCPSVFCRKCILQNFSKNFITEIEKNDNWRCFSCAPTSISHLRAQHWALTNHLRQTKSQIRSMTDGEQLYELMYQDLTLCCKGKEPLNSRQNPKDKRRHPCNDASSAPDPKRIRHRSVDCNQPAEESATSGAMQLSNRTSTLPMPTIVSQKSVTPPPLTLRKMPASSAEPQPPPPVTIRQLHSLSSGDPASPLRVVDLPLSTSSVQTAAFPNSQLPAVPQMDSSCYQTYNLVVDLATKETSFVRLPNGKLIQVQRNADTLQQTAPILIQNNSSYVVTNQAPSTQKTSQPSLQIINVGHQQQPQSTVSKQQPQRQQSFQQPLQIVSVGQQSLQQHRQQPSGQPSLPPQQQSLYEKQPVPSQRKQQQQRPNGVSNTPKPQPQNYPNTPLGQAQTMLQKEVHCAQEICQQIVGKCNAFMKSNAYNSVQGFNDVRDLQQHLSYLCTYAVDRFTTLKGKCTGEMKSLTVAHEETKKLAEAKDEGNKNYTNVDDDVQVVETVTECIEIDSDDDAEPNVAPPPVGIVKKQSQTTSHQVEPNDVPASSVIIIKTDTEEFEIPTLPVLVTKKTGSYDLYDGKLKGTPIVVLEKDANIELKLHEIVENDALTREFVPRQPIDSMAVLDSETNAVRKTCNDSVDDKDAHDIEMASNKEGKNDPAESDHQAKLKDHIEDTNSDQCDDGTVSNSNLSHLSEDSFESVSSPDRFDNMPRNPTAENIVK